MSRTKKMLLLMGALVIMVGCYFLASQTQETETVQEESGTFELTAKTAEDIATLAWMANDTEYSFTLTDGVWYKTSNTAYPVAQDEVQALADSLIAMQGSRRIESVTDISIYGLSEPVFSVTATWTDGTETTYQMGNETPFGGSYYLLLSGDATTVYTTEDSLSDLFDKDVDDFIQAEDVPSVSDVDRITVGTTFDASKHETSSTINEDELWYAADGRALDGVDSIVSSFTNLSWAAVAEPVATDDQLTEYGLDDANAIAVTVYAGEESATVLFGTTNDSGYYYARLPGSTMVYTVSSSTATKLLNASADSLLSLAIIETEYDNVQEAIFTAGELTYSFSAKAEEAEETADESAEAADAEESTEAAEETEEEDANETLWNLVTAVTASSLRSEAATGDTVLTISVTTRTGVSATFTFAEYNADNYTATDGERTLIVEADKVDKLIRTLKNMQ